MSEISTELEQIIRSSNQSLELAIQTSDSGNHKESLRHYKEAEDGYGQGKKLIKRSYYLIVLLWVVSDIMTALLPSIVQWKCVSKFHKAVVAPKHPRIKTTRKSGASGS